LLLGGKLGELNRSIAQSCNRKSIREIRQSPNHATVEQSVIQSIGKWQPFPLPADI
jgi:hypothetical protein